MACLNLGTNATLDNTNEFRIALFGPQVIDWTNDSLSNLQSTLLADVKLDFLRQALTTLPSLWPLLEEGGSSHGLLGQQKLKELRDFATGARKLDPQALTNTHLSALTIVAQAVNLVGSTDASCTKHGILGFDAAQGFCVGFLSAAALASAHDWTNVETNFSNAVRLAACVGTAIDAENTLSPDHERATAVHVRWKLPEDRAYFETYLDQLSGAYVSCIIDDRNITITLPSNSQAEFCLRMREAKIAATPIGLSGCYHHSSNAKVAEKLSQFCAENRGLRLPDAKKLRLPLRSTSDANLINEGALHDIAIQTILCKRAHWFQTVKSTLGDAPQGEVALVPFGNESCVPRSLSSEKHRKTIALDHVGKTSLEEIAVIGMACRYPKANNLEEFRQLLWAGESAISKMPPERFNPAELDRQPKLANFWGNFLHNPDGFDHRFFNISGREAKSMDPQQRLALQVAYEALESSGYCSTAPVNGADVGCYLGVGSVDYDDNIASHDANAFAATGTLRAFISGRISHFFGWSGPSLTFDTACSSSAVAIHTASKAILSGECSMALAGGVNVITSPTLHQNLSAASFLNPNGASRAFDAEAHGYCRGEGAGILVLKTLSKAKADGDTILGVVAASAVNQGTNMTNITVPDSDSQSSLYNKVLSAARIEPKEVTYVEAHGTGTPVGDPIEYESVRLALAGPWRRDQVFLGSVKDNIGHTEAASGVAGVIKTILMMQYKTIPKQANFKSLNPRIKASASVIVPQTTRSWTAQRRVALVNNYGAAGSNAALVLRDHPDTPSITTGRGIQATAPLSACVSPILLSAKTANGLQSYVNVLKTYLPTLHSVESVAYNIARSHNSSFKHRAAFVAADVQSAISGLDSSYAVTDESAIGLPKRPVVLCFGGQTSRKIRVSKDLYERCDLFRIRLDECDGVCQTLGLPSIYPDIFLGDDIDDIVYLHCMLLSLQVTCAKCWIDCGLEVNTVVGHSFGQLTALCIADCISLKDAFFFVSSRARLIRDSWGLERGTMLSVECDQGELEAVVRLVNSTSGLRLDVACYNGPRSFVLAGNEPSIEKAEKECRSLKTTRLRNSHAYHSHLANDILDPLAGVAKVITIRPPRIRIETCSVGRTWSQFTAENLVQHTRESVHFTDAIERIASHLPSAIWLEAGSSSPVIPMTRRIIASKSGRMDIFVPIEIGDADAATNLAKVACQLWLAGSVTQHWLFHNSSQHQYTKINLPPYQFDKSSHWVQYKPRSEPKVKETSDLVNVLIDDSAPVGDHLFAVDTANAEFELAARGHAVAGQYLCPASMYIELAARCVMDLQRTNDTGKRYFLPYVEGLTMSAPLGLGTGTAVFLRLKETEPTIWEFAVVSRLSSSGLTKRITHGEIEHARGRISSVGGRETQTQRLLRLLQRSSVYHAQDSVSATGVNGSMVYKLFSDVVEYASYFRGVQSVSACGTEAIGLVTTSTDKTSSFNASICDFISLDNFLQVAGIHVNCLSPRDNDQVFICTAVEEVIFSSSFMTNRDASRAWTVHNRYEPKALVEVTNNIMVCDSLSGDLVLAIIGARFKSIRFKSVARSLAKLNKGSTNSNTTAKLHSDDSDDLRDSTYQTGSPSPSGDWPEPEVSLQTSMSPMREMAPKLYTPQTISIEPQQESQLTTSSALSPLLCSMFSAILEVPVQEIKPTATLDDLGIDSLLVTEVLSEIKTRFSVSLEQAQLMTCPDIASVASLIQGTRTPPKHQEPIEATHKSKARLINGDKFTKLTNRQNLTNGDRLTNGHSATDGSDLTKADDISTGDSFSNGDAYTNGHKLMDNYPSEVPGEESKQIFTNHHEDRQPQETNANLAVVCCDCFVDANALYDQCAALTGFAGFCGKAFSLQSELVVQYVVEAFASVGCPLRALKFGDEVPAIRFEVRHKKLVSQLYRILRDADLVTEGTGGQFLRTKKPISTIPTSALLDEMLEMFPKHASETRLLQTTAHRLADCLSGVADPLALLFRDAKARTLLEDVYTNAPMFKTGTSVLTQYLLKVFARVGASREIKILELGAGTGGTSKQLIETLAELGPKYKFSYTFTDLSSSLVAAARRKFSKWPFMHYMVLDIEDDPDSQLMDAYDIIMSTNCIHATKSLVQSCTNIRKMLRADSVLCLVELTRNLYWFDLVFGLLEGWWLFNDGREHALADEQRWKRCLHASGFGWVDWTSSPAAESNILRVITASPYRSAPLGKDDGLIGERIPQRNVSSDHNTLKETVTFKEVDGLSLLADIYYPAEVVESEEKLPVALMIHGGGHIMLSRNDVRPEQTSTLLRSGFVPISIDYRLCPETTLLDGPMTDVADALVWIRTLLPKLTLSRRDIRVDPNKVVVVGWSTGGHLAMTLAWTSAARQIRPPEAILVFYCPTDYEDPFWTSPNIPIGAPQTTDISMMTKASPSDYDKQTIFEGIFDAPILAYNIPPEQRALGGWLAPSDKRSRLALYMNAHGRTLHLLLGGPPAPNSIGKSRKESLIDDGQQQAPTLKRIKAASPLAQIRAGNYAAVPTFLIHPRKDDLIPWQQAERTWQALRDRGGADAELRIVEDVPHLFDMYPLYYRGNQAAMEAIEEGYRFLCRYVAVEWRG